MQSQSFTRKQRVADLIGREIASLLLTELNDPRARGLTVSDVELSADMRMATIYVSAPGDCDIEEMLKALRHAGGFLRKRLARQVHLKYLPRLQFRYDASLDRSDRIEQLLRNAAGSNPDEP